MVPRKKTYNLLVHQRAGSRDFLEGAGARAGKQIFKGSLEPGAGEKRDRLRNTACNLQLLCAIILKTPL